MVHPQRGAALILPGLSPISVLWVLLLALTGCADERPPLHLQVEYRPALPASQERLIWDGLARLVEAACHRRVVEQRTGGVPTWHVRLQKKLGRHYLQVMPSGDPKIRFEPNEGRYWRSDRLRAFLQQLAENLPGS